MTSASTGKMKTGDRIVVGKTDGKGQLERCSVEGNIKMQLK
jgi:hypothetical protein